MVTQARPIYDGGRLTIADSSFVLNYVHYVKHYARCYFVDVQIVKLIDYVKWLLAFIDDGKLIPVGEDLFVSG